MPGFGPNAAGTAVVADVTGTVTTVLRTTNGVTGTVTGAVITTRSPEVVLFVNVEAMVVFAAVPAFGATTAKYEKPVVRAS